MQTRTSPVRAAVPVADAVLQVQHGGVLRVGARQEDQGRLQRFPFRHVPPRVPGVGVLLLPWVPPLPGACVTRRSLTSLRL